MSLNKKKELVQVAKVVCRELRQTSTRAEKIFWTAVRNRNLCNKKFDRQFPVFHDITGKETFFIADFYCFEEKLIVEIDGPIHAYRLAEDKLRTEILNSLGLRVIRFRNEEVEKNLNLVLRELIKTFNN